MQTVQFVYDKDKFVGYQGNCCNCNADFSINSPTKLNTHVTPWICSVCKAEQPLLCEKGWGENGELVEGCHKELHQAELVLVVGAYTDIYCPFCGILLTIG